MISTVKVCLSYACVRFMLPLSISKYLLSLTLPISSSFVSVGAHALKKNTDTFRLGSLLGTIHLLLSGVLAERLIRVEDANLLALTTSIHQLDQVDLDFVESLYSLSY